MIAPTATVNEMDVSRIDSLLKRILMATTKATPDLLTQAFVFAVQSATKATKPGPSGRVSTMAKPFKVRPIESLPAQAGHWYLWTKKDGSKRMIQIPREIRNSKNLSPVVRGIKRWDKKANSWAWWPTMQKGKYASGKAGKIPNYGAAKAGFLHMLGKLGRPQDTGELRSSLATVSRRLSGLDQGITGVNEVSYASITSPDAAQIGLDKAASRLEHTYRRALEGILA
jgi:hypothetical protein